jgi:hypothetical protein
MSNNNENFLQNMLRNKKTTQIVIIIIILTIIFSIGFWIFSRLTLKERNCDHLKNIYKENPPLTSFSPADSKYQHNLRDYYIKTAYNCCCGGGYKNDFVSKCALEYVIKQGARCLDFEIYSIDNKPVISAASIDDYSIKEMYNSIPFSEAMKFIDTHAFSGGTCPNPNDPLILHFRIMSKRKDIYTQMAKILTETLEPRLLDESYSYENGGKNLGADKIANFSKKVIIAVDKSNPIFVDTPLDEYVNIASNAVFMRALREDQVIYTPDMDELLYYNSKNMTIVLPNLSPDSKNMNAEVCMRFGCQMIAMSFQNLDKHLEYYNLLFDKIGHAFKLKPKSMRYNPTKVQLPAPLHPELSFKPRIFDTPSGPMEI